MPIKKYCRRFTLNGIIRKVVADSYDHFSLHEPDDFEEWQWIDSVPFVEEWQDSHN